MATNDFNSTENCLDWYEPYREFHRLNLTKIFIIVLSLLALVWTIAMLLGIIWYEHYGADSKRILTNKLVALICWNEIFGIVLAFLTDATIYIMAPLPKSLCLLSGFVRMMFASNILMLFNMIMISKYIFIFWMKNPGSVMDDFWTLFIHLWTVAFNAIFNTVRLFHPAQEQIYYYICLDIDPSVDKLLPMRDDDSIDVVVFVIVHVVVATRVKIFGCSHQQQQQEQQSKKISFYRRNVEKINLADFLTNFVIVIWVLSLAMFAAKIKLFSVEDIGKPEASLELFAFLFISNSGTGLVMSAAYFFRHKHLRKKLWSELRGFVTC